MAGVVEEIELEVTSATLVSKGKIIPESPDGRAVLSAFVMQPSKDDDPTAYFSYEDQRFGLRMINGKLHVVRIVSKG